MRAFLHLREMMDSSDSSKELGAKLDALEKNTTRSSGQLSSDPHETRTTSKAPAKRVLTLGFSDSQAVRVPSTINTH